MNRKRKRAFTILESIIAISMFSLFMVSIYKTLSNIQVQSNLDLNLARADVIARNEVQVIRYTGNPSPSGTNFGDFTVTVTVDTKANPVSKFLPTPANGLGPPEQQIKDYKINVKCKTDRNVDLTISCRSNVN